MSSLAQIGCLFHELNQQMYFRKKKGKISINLVLKRFTANFNLGTHVCSPHPHTFRRGNFADPSAGAFRFPRYVSVLVVIAFVVVGVSIVKATGHRNLH